MQCGDLSEIAGTVPFEIRELLRCYTFRNIGVFMERRGVGFYLIALPFSIRALPNVGAEISGLIAGMEVAELRFGRKRARRRLG